MENYNPTQITHLLNDAIRKQLSQCDLDLVGMVPFPSNGDKMVRFKTIQEIVEECDVSKQDGVVGYLLQVRPKATSSSLMEQLPSLPGNSKSASENLYLPNGKMNIPYLVRNADLLFEAGDFGLARNIYKAILLSGETNGPILFRLARCLEAEGKFPEAKEKYEESIAYHPTLEGYQKLAALLIRQNKDREGAEVLERALNLKDLPRPIRYEMHKSCGNCWTRAQHQAEAERHYKCALELNPLGDDVRSNLGALCLQRGDIVQSKRNFADALASNPNNYNALAGLGSCALSEGEHKAAHDYFSQSLNIEINNATAIYYLIKCAYAIKTYSVAARLLEKYTQIAPVNPTLLYSLAGLLFHVGKISEAKTTALKILELQPQHAGAKELLEIVERCDGDGN